ncbi:outer membrane lipoprotein-sorting protein [Leptospira sp. GIMC2001]|uniref:outer membrane lipoprotein-sorting protein n=1 Tax=Leptospira sp. GIMC2001 TaxID=1513297 RepID=UPI00234A43FB|nr:outer membrane lipoprotein-sorting protein [Leptospira sp. GIMC2001]WCL48340.1 outer membrane lipoprotein-sorting protein [Leptospira sp. GIMC2001]
MRIFLLSIRIIFISVLLFMTDSSSFLQAQVASRNAQEILARLDEELNLGNGLTKANLVLIRRNGQSETWKVSLFRNDGNSLYLMERKGRGLETKLLSLDEGDRIYLFNSLSSKMFRKAEEEKYEIFQNSGFSYVDLSGYLYQANYDPIMNGEMEIASKTYLRVSMKPIITYEYKKLVLLMSKDELRPFRIDFHDRDGVLSKSLNIKYAPVKVKTSSGTTTKELAARLEMLDLNTGNIGILEISELDSTVKTDPAIYSVDNLGR